MYFLTGPGLDLRGGALGTLLGNLSLTTGTAGSSLSLLSLLGGSGLGLLSLSGSNGLSAGSSAGLRTERAALLDHIEGSTNDGTLGLDGAASALLGDLL